MKLSDVKNQIIQWVNEFRWCRYKEEDCIYADEERGRVRLVLYTDNNKYSISARPPKEECDKGYLGCIATTRKPRAGEDWSRGNDLADGSFSFQTWYRILQDIIGYELVKIHRPLKHHYEPGDEKAMADET